MRVVSLKFKCAKTNILCIELFIYVHSSHSHTQARLPLKSFLKLNFEIVDQNSKKKKTFLLK